jgi:hypothetical protein
MANKFGTDILIQAQGPMKAARFYVEHLGFEITDDNPKMIGQAWAAHQSIYRNRSADGAGGISSAPSPLGALEPGMRSYSVWHRGEE